LEINMRVRADQMKFGTNRVSPRNEKGI